MKKLLEDRILNEENIDAVSQAIQDYLAAREYQPEAVTSVWLSIETVLIEWLANGGAGKRFTVEARNSFGRLHIYAMLEGQRIDYLSTDADTDFLDTIEQHLRGVLSVRYVDGVNVVDVKLPRRSIGSLGQVGIAFALACALGVLLPLIFPQKSLQEFSGTYLTPGYSAIIGVLGGFAVFQIFLSIMDSIIHMGDVTVLRNLGGKYVKMMSATMVLTTIAGGAIMLLFCPVISSEGAGKGSASATIYKLFVDIVPTNLIKPFIDGNMLQVLFIACFIGTILLILHDEIIALHKSISDANKAFQYAVVILSKLLPLFIFMSLLSIFLNGQIGLVLDSWHLLFVHAVCCLAVALIMLTLASVYTGISLKLLVKMCLPVLFVGWSTASTIATVPDIRKVLESCRVDENISKFSINLGYVLSRHTCCMVTMSIITCYYAILGKQMSLEDFVMLAVISMALSVAAPSTPGSGAAIIANLMMQYGLPMEVVAVVLSIDYFMDMGTTGTGCVCIAAEGVIMQKLAKQ
ncbi:MAG: cation:dicarboxylase symporter family transporter [Selenomonadaceae bacterium]|nr:cation:dicarboxylase symporter family transporter [Selenomonadaceae bacterium]